ncbi:MAG: hypothetical protein CVV27_13185 [Candidatus Melainabacteria bacterium HGW-Melainabacteria-1]|nr:MAG: hypothetical protein CVV27_13185 [Candidatus Melainabacteria bacterium HGW-Melainabacteria-1]
MADIENEELTQVADSDKKPKKRVVNVKKPATETAAPAPAASADAPATTLTDEDVAAAEAAAVAEHQAEQVSAAPMVPPTPLGETPPDAYIQIEASGQVALAWIDQPGKKVNLLSPRMLDEVERVLDEVSSHPELKVLIFASRKRDNFIAGADLTTMVANGFDLNGAVAFGQRGRTLFQRLAELNLTTIAAIHGSCLGGGLELALACDYRLAANDDKTKLGLPEVQLGILPAWGGVSRLPRLISLPDALDMMLTGKQVRARKAKSLGLVHMTPPPELLIETAQKLAADVLASQAGYADKKHKSSLMDKALNQLPLGQNLVFKQARKSVLEKSKGFYPAPLKILETVQNSINLPLSEAFKLEADAFENLLQRSETGSLMNLFFINQELGKSPEGVKPGKVKQLGVLGAGYMGAGIAQVSNAKNIDVRLKDVNYQALLTGMKHVHQAYAKLVSRKRLKQKEADDRMRKLTVTTDYSGFKHADLVIEAVVEKMEVKKAVFNELEAHIGPHTILASNTSALSINEMAAATARPDRFIGLHFFGPVQQMPLVEVILGEQTSDQTLATALAYVRSIGKTPVVIRKDLPGFVVNRVLMVYGNEAGLLLEEGADITTIDRLMSDFGMPMGIFEVIDLAGIDVAYHTANSVDALFSQRPGFQRSRVVEKLFADGRYGQKSGRGFYIYAGKDNKIPDHRYVQQVVEGLGGTKREISAEEIRDRLVLSLLNESALCLQEGLVELPGEIDMAMLMGTGFPPFRGGPLRLIDQQGIQFIVNQLEYYAETRGARFAPCQLLKDMAAKGQKFYPLI